METATEVNSRRKQVEELLRELGSVLVAFSGGVDSALLAAVAARVLGEQAAAATAVSPSLAPGELDDARSVAAQIGIRHLEVPTDEVDDPAYAANAPDRCFHCKNTAYGVFTAVALREGFAAVIDGTNADDSGDFRPGRQAASQHGVRSPLAEIGMGKEEVRAWAQELGLTVWDKPASACLSSRIPYGSPVTPEKLTQIARAESAARRLGFLQCRVRHHGDIARIEIEADQLAEALARRSDLVAAVRAAGFPYVTLDLDGFRSGSMNEVMRKASR